MTFTMDTRPTDMWEEKKSNPCTCERWWKRLMAVAHETQFFVRTECPRHGELLLDNRAVSCSACEEEVVEANDEPTNEQIQ